MKIGLLGGSFDPVHNAHLRLARAAQKQLKLDIVYLVLARQSPFKTTLKTTPVFDRARMLKLAVKNEKKIKSAFWEIRRKGPSYTVVTLRAYKKRHPQDEIYLVMGSDAYHGLPKWKDAKKIRSLATVVVGKRPGTRLVSSGRDVVLKGSFPNISSTRIRHDVGAGRSVRTRLPKRIETYILKRCLYASV